MLFLDEQVVKNSQDKLFSVDVFVHKLIIYTLRTFGSSVGIRWLVCIRMSYPKLVLRASLKVGNEEKFFAMRTSLLNLEDFFNVLPCAHLATQEKSSLACLPN
jgi:hypothetical protein